MKSKRDDFDITRDDDGALVLSGDSIERLFKMTDFSVVKMVFVVLLVNYVQWVSMKHLRERGAEDGDTVRLLEFEFDFVD